MLLIFVAENQGLQWPEVHRPVHLCENRLNCLTADNVDRVLFHSLLFSVFQCPLT
jgi:hypothetical protein